MGGSSLLAKCLEEGTIGRHRAHRAAGVIGPICAVAVQAAEKDAITSDFCLLTEENARSDVAAAADRGANQGCCGISSLTVGQGKWEESHVF